MKTSALSMSGNRPAVRLKAGGPTLNMQHGSKESGHHGRILHFFRSARARHSDVP